MKVIEVDKFLTGLAGGKWDDEGLLFGEAEREVKGILVAWMPTPEALSSAVKRGCNLIICHEELLFPYLKERDEELVKDSPHWVANRKRLEIIQKNNLCVIRSHYRADETFNIDEFARAVGLSKPIEQNPLVRIYEIDHIPVRSFAKQVKEKLRIDKIEVIGNLDFAIKRLGIAIGGMSLGICLDFIEHNYLGKGDTILSGEMDEYGRSGHVLCENIGLKIMAGFLRKQFPDLPIVFFENRLPGEYIAVFVLIFIMRILLPMC